MMLSAWRNWACILSGPSDAGLWNRKSSMSTPATLMHSLCRMRASSEETQLAHAGSCRCPNMQDCCWRKGVSFLFTASLFFALDDR